MGELSPEQTFNAGGAVLASILKIDQPPLFFRDDKEQTLSQQGEHLPLLIGRRRVAPIVGWTGVTEACLEVSVSLFLRLVTEGFEALAPSWCEAGTHWLCVGPVQKLHMIYNDGTPVLIDTITGGPFPLTPQNLPSGQAFPLHVTIDLWSDMLGILLDGSPLSGLTPFASQLLDAQSQLTKNQQGVFNMYWGEPNQPINTRMDFVNLATKLGLGGNPEAVSSRWPRICYVFWDKKFLGPQPIWPTMEYDIECRPFNTGALIQSQSWLTRTPTANNPLDVEDAGANPAHALYQVLTGDYPYGMGISPSLIDMPALEQLGIICENEHLPVNILAKDGIDAASQIADILQDIGVVAAHLKHKLFFEAARAPDVSSPPPTLPADMILIPEADQEIDHSNRATRYVLTFKDFRSRQRQSAVVIDDDGVSEAGNRISEVQSTMPTITDEKTAQKVGQRRAAEALAGTGVFRFKMGRSAREFRPGTMFRLDGWGLLRVLSVKLQTDTSVVLIDAALDNYGVIDSGHRPEDVVGNDDLNTELATPLLPDLAINWLEPPRSFYSTAPAIMAFRIAANTQSRYAHVRVSYDNNPIDVFTGDAQHYHSGGTLNDAMPAGGLTILSPGPTITLLGGDLLQVLDLSEDDQAFRLGNQWALINEEVWFVKSVTALGSSQFQLDEVIRGRFHTDQDAHASGDVVIIAPRNDLQAFHHPIMDSVNNVPKPLTIKTAPFSPIGGVNHAGGPSAPHDFFGMDLAPWPVDNFRANATTWSKDTYGTGDDILFEWTYRLRDGQGTGAGEGAAGEPIGDPPAGLQLLKIYEADGWQLKHSLLVTGTSYNYTNANLVADFGSEPGTLIARVRPIDVGRTNKTREITVTLI